MDTSGVAQGPAALAARSLLEFPNPRSAINKSPWGVRHTVTFESSALENSKLCGCQTFPGSRSSARSVLSSFRQMLPLLLDTHTPSLQSQTKPRHHHLVVTPPICGFFSAMFLDMFTHSVSKLHEGLRIFFKPGNFIMENGEEPRI